MPETRHYVAVDSQGVTHKRSTTRFDRNYTHCVVARGISTAFGNRAPFVRAEFASREASAEATASKWRGKSHCTSVEVLEVRLAKVTGRKREAA